MTMGQHNGNDSSNTSSFRNRNGGLNGGPYSSQSMPQPTTSSAPSSAASRGVRFESGTLFLDGDDQYRDGDDNSMGDNIMNWLVDAFYGALAFQCFLGLMTVVIFLYIVVRPFSVTVYRRLVNQIGLGGYIEAVSLLLPSTRICLTGDSDIPSPVGTSILVSNHVLDADWYSALMLGRCVGLRGSVKVFLRNEFLHLNKGTAANASYYNNDYRPSRASATRNGSNSNIHSGSTGQLNQVGMWSVAAPRSNSNGSAVNGSYCHMSSLSSLNGGGGGGGALSTTAISAPSSPTSSQRHGSTSLDLRLVAGFLRSFLEFPLIDEEDYVSDRESLFELLRSFADRSGTSAPVHFLLYPEGWSLYNGENRSAVLARSNEFAKREGRPQLKHLLLPRTTGFNASISCLRESNPVVYDMTVAYRGYDGSIPPKGDLSVFSLWGLLRRQYPPEIHVRMVRVR
jgi:hypothetical protein